MEKEMQILLEKNKEMEKYNVLLQNKVEEQDVYKKKVRKCTPKTQSFKNINNSILEQNTLLPDSHCNVT